MYHHHVHYWPAEFFLHVGKRRVIATSGADGVAHAQCINNLVGNETRLCTLGAFFFSVFGVRCTVCWSSPPHTHANMSPSYSSP